MTDTIPEAVVEAMADKIDWHNDYSPCQHDNELAGVRAALKAAQALGWKLVPVEPTEAMREAAKDARARQPAGTTPGISMADAYRAMIAASPEVG